MRHSLLHKNRKRKKRKNCALNNAWPTTGFRTCKTRGAFAIRTTYRMFKRKYTYQPSNTRLGWQREQNHKGKGRNRRREKQSDQQLFCEKKRKNCRDITLIQPLATGSTKIIVSQVLLCKSQIIPCGCTGSWWHVKLIRKVFRDTK